MTTRPRRSVLYMPGSNGRAMEKARSLPADGIILDLEDAVAPDAKIAAREQVIAAVKAGGFGSREVFVRINALDTPWGSDDLTAVAACAPDAILVPKVAGVTQIEMLGQRLLDMHVDLRTRLWVMIETPLAVLNAAAIAACAKDSESRLDGFVMGTNDIAKETRARLVPGRWPMMPWLMHCIAAARVYGIDILDGVHNDIADEEGFAAECAAARDMGFDGKTLIHPKQIGPCNAAFTPPAEEVATARGIIAAFDAPENRGKGVVQLDGRMVERLHADVARRTVAIAEAIEARGG
jgi:citrate lyase subunit beta / citryl-CoA lyase